MTNNNILVIDDEINIRLSIKSCLCAEGYQVTDLANAHTAMEAMQENIYDAAIIDIRLGKVNGIQLFERMQAEKIDTPVIFISGNANLGEAAQTLKLGAYDFIEKPFNADKLLVTINNCIELHHLKRRVIELESSNQSQPLLGDHKLMQALRNTTSKVSNSDVAVLITGESGTGKELIAQSIHQQSKRKNNSLISVNCSAIPENLIDSALFGHVRGAFTGAEHHKKGYFEVAHKGTIFLDEIADMPLSSQGSLLRVLENKEIQKVGSEKIIKVDVRLIAASHKDLLSLVEKGSFRQDLYYRLNVVPVKSPALRERRSDIPLLINYFVKKLCQNNGFAIKDFDQECYVILQDYDWPGNVRELLNTIERMLILGDQKITKRDIPEEIQNKKHLQKDEEANNTLTLKEFRNNMERSFIIKKLTQFGGNITQVAKALGVDRSYLHKKITQLSIKRTQDFD